MGVAMTVSSMRLYLLLLCCCLRCQSSSHMQLYLGSHPINSTHL